MADEQVTIENAHERILTQLQGAFPVFANVGDYGLLTVKKGENRERLVVPAAILHMESFEPESNPGTGQRIFSVRWELRIMLNTKIANHDRKLRGLSVAVARWIDGNRFGKGYQARFIRSEEDQFDARLITFRPWLIEFEQSYLLGEDVWEDEGTPPTEVYGSWVPLVGADHEDDYEQIEEVKPITEG